MGVKFGNVNKNLIKCFSFLQYSFGLYCSLPTSHVQCCRIDFTPICFLGEISLGICFSTEHSLVKCYFACYNHDNDITPFLSSLFIYIKRTDFIHAIDIIPTRQSYKPHSPFTLFLFNNICADIIYG